MVGAFSEAPSTGVSPKGVCMRALCVMEKEDSELTVEEREVLKRLEEENRYYNQQALISQFTRIASRTKGFA